MSERGQEPDERGLDTSEDTYSEPASEPRSEPGEQKSFERDDAPSPATEDDTEPEGSGDGEYQAGSTRQPGADPEDAEEIEQERQERLDPENRPDNAEVDNTDRDFDATKGKFTDAEDYQETEAKFPDIGEQGA